MKNKNSNLAYRTVISIKRFLERNGYEILESAKEMNPCQIIALNSNKDTIAFIHTDYVLGSDDDDTEKLDAIESKLDRQEFERQAIKWLCNNNDIIDVAVRFDCAICDILSNDRALIRHHINILGEN